MKKLILCLVLILSFGINCVALNNIDIIPGESVIVSVETEASPNYSYTFSDGGTTRLLMGYVTTDNYSLGTPRTNARGNISWIYCMEFEVQVHSAITRLVATPESSNNVIWTGLSSEQKQGIELALLYGYPNSLNGVAAADSFAATQAVIWEFQTGVRNSITSNTRRSVTYNYRSGLSSFRSMSISENYFYNMISTTSAGIQAYNNIVSNIYRHYLQPNFGISGTSIPLTYDYSKGAYTTTLTDRNNVLSTYDVVVSSADGAQVTTSGNKLTITCAKKITNTSFTLKKKNMAREGQELVILSSTGYGQSLVSGSKQLPVQYSYSTYSTNDAGRILVTKTDAESGTRISGVVFRLYNSSGQLVGTKTTNSNGEIVFDYLNLGTYRLEEVSAPSGYDLNVINSENVVVDKVGGTKNVTVTNDISKQHISVYKKGEVLKGFDDDNVPIYEEEYLADCEVEVYAATDIFGPDGTLKFSADELVDTVVTTDSGPADTIDLYPGEYYLREVSAPEGFVISSGDQNVSLSLEPAEVTFYDLRQRCELFFKKTLSNITPDAMSDYYKYVSFGVYNATDIMDLPADSLLETIVPDEYGNCIMSVDLPYGYDYYIKEITTADDYIIDENVYSFSFTELTDSDSVKIITLGSDNEIINEMKPVDIVLSVSDAPMEEVPEETIPDTNDPNVDYKFLAIIVFVEFLVLIDFIGYKFYNLFV